MYMGAQRQSHIELDNALSANSYTHTHTHTHIYIYICKDQIWILSPNDGWTQAQKAQNNEFVESGLENWDKMSWMTNKVNSNDKNSR